MTLRGASAMRAACLVVVAPASRSTGVPPVSLAGDKIEDPSIAWPETRTLVKLGTISVERIAPNQATASDAKEPTLTSMGNLSNLGRPPLWQSFSFRGRRSTGAAR